MGGMTAHPEASAADILATPAPAPDSADQGAHATPALPEDRFADRELSWLAFNERVLELSTSSSWCASPG